MESVCNKNPNTGISNGELIYNDELLEALSTIILLGNKPGAAYVSALPEIKRLLYDYDIYRISFMSDGDVEKLYKSIANIGVNGARITDKKLKTKLMAIRDNARVFVEIASEYNSVRGYIDKTIAKEGREKGLAILTDMLSGTGSRFKLKQVGAAACNKFLSNF